MSTDNIISLPLDEEIWRAALLRNPDPELEALLQLQCRLPYWRKQEEYYRKRMKFYCSKLSDAQLEQHKIEQEIRCTIERKIRCAIERDIRCGIGRLKKPQGA
jgi:hypothetical protein